MPRNSSSNNRRQYPAPKSGKNKKNYVVETQHEQVIKVEPTTRKKFSKHDIKYVKPLTENQLLAFQEWGQGQHLVMSGFPGTGKTLIATYLALKDVLDPDMPQDKIVIVRSPLQSGVQLGYMPGDLEEKVSFFEMPYIQICDFLFKWGKSYENLKEIGVIEFYPTNFLRGCTWDNAIIILDEFQNADDTTLTTVCARLGNDSRLIICGDTISQNDMGSKSGGDKLLSTLKKMDEVSFVNFNPSDCVRSEFVKNFLIAKYC